MYNNYFKFLLILGCLYTFINTNANAQQRDTSLNEVVISAAISRSPIKESTLVQIINKKSIDQLGFQNLSDAVKTLSGVSVKDYGGVGGVKTVSIRSLGAQHTAISYDGVTLSNAQSGQIDLGQFSLDNIDEVSLSIGLGDNIFQPARNFASSGILNIKSQRPKFDKGNFNGGVQIKVGSFGYFNPSLSLQTKISNNWSASFNGDWARSTGDYPFKLINGNVITKERRDNSKVNVLRGEINLYGNVGKSGRLFFKGNYLDSSRELPGSVVLYNTDAHEKLWDKNGFLQAGYNNSFSEKWSLDANLKYTYSWTKYRDQGNKYPNGEIVDVYTQNEYYSSVAAKFTPNKFFLFTFAQDVFENTLVSNLPDAKNPDRLTSMSAVAGQYISTNLTITTSLLYVYMKENINSINKYITRDHFSPNISLSYKVLKNKNLRVRASFKESFRVPTFNDLYYSRIGNSSLTPEKALQYNMGITFSDKLFGGSIDYFSVSVDGYFNNVKDKIVAIPTLFIWKMMNMGKVNIWGGDINISSAFNIGKYFNFNLSGNYSYQSAKDVSNKSDKNYKHQIPYTPKNSGNIQLSCNNRWVNVAYMISIVGDRYALPQNISANLIDRYCEQNVSVNKEFDFGRVTLRLQGEILNVANVNYDIIKNYPMPGRQYRITINTKF